MARPHGLDVAGTPEAAWTFDAIGTRWTITTEVPLDRVLADRVTGVIAEYDALWSRFRDDSAVALIAAGGTEDLGPTAPPLLDLLDHLRRLTDGAMDPFVAASLDHLGYGAGGDLVPQEGYRPAPTAAIRLDGTRVGTTPPALLDVGSAGKGQLADLVADTLRAAGLTGYIVDAGGDIVAAGAPLRVALEHPYDRAAAIGVVEVADGAIAGSAVNRRDWTQDGGRRLHHVLDARTGRPVETIAATWVLAESAMLADALSTALFFVTPEALMDLFDFRYVRMRTDGVATRSPDLPGELFR